MILKNSRYDKIAVTSQKMGDDGMLLKMFKPKNPKHGRNEDVLIGEVTIKYHGHNIEVTCYEVEEDGETTTPYSTQEIKF